MSDLQKTDTQQSNPMEALASNETPGPVQLNSVTDVWNLGKILAQSGFFSDIKDASQACVKILAGAELGLPAISSMRGVHVYDGQTSLHYSLVAALIKRHPKYDYQEVESTDKRAEIAFFEKRGDSWDEIGRSSFSIEDAKQAGLLRKNNWKKYPADMLFGRAMTRGARRYTSEATSGPIYTPEELDHDGENAAVVEVDHETGEIEQSGPPTITGAQRKKMFALAGELYDDKEDFKRGVYKKYGMDSIGDLSKEQAGDVIERLENAVENRNGSQEPDPTPVQEAVEAGMEKMNSSDAEDGVPLGLDDVVHTGQYHGLTVQQILQKDPDYIVEMDKKEMIVLDTEAQQRVAEVAFGDHEGQDLFDEEELPGNMG